MPRINGSISRRLLLLALCVVVAGIAASTARAADVIVNPFRCQTFQGGAMTVPAGSAITVRSGFSEQTLGILTAYLNAQTTTISINGSSVDVSNAFSDPVNPGPGLGWVSFAAYPNEITLAAGESLSVVWTTTLAHPVPEVFNPAAGGPAGKPV